MPEQNQRPFTPNPANALNTLAGWCAYVSGITAVLGIVFLAIFFTIGGFSGTLNDIAVIIQYSLMLPISLSLYNILRPYKPTLSLVALLIGLAGMIGVIILQLLLVAGVLPFSQQIGMVIVAFLVVLVWFVLNGYLGRSTTIVPNSTSLTILAGLYVGYPLWAFKVGHRLLEK